MTEGFNTELVESALSGDIKSFGRLCQSYYSAMVAIGYAILCNHQLAEDAAQESFVRALKNLRKLKSKEKFGFWLARICRNVAKDMAKVNSRRFDSQEIAMAAKNNNEPDNHTVRNAISKLSARERELITLRYYDNYSYKQMGIVLGLSKAAINNRLIRARHKIAKYLLNDGFTEVEL